MSGHTHIRQLDGFTRGPLTNSVRPYPDQIRFSLNNLNGSDSWGYALWRAPEGADLLHDIPVSDVYLQCAGSAAAMTIELRAVGENGVAHRYVVGKDEGPTDGDPTEVVRWDNGRHYTRVFSHEVFDAAEAAEIVYAYFVTDTVPESYTLRELDPS